MVGRCHYGIMFRRRQVETQAHGSLLPLLTQGAALVAIDPLEAPFEASDRICQSWAYSGHTVGAT